MTPPSFIILFSTTLLAVGPLTPPDINADESYLSRTAMVEVGSSTVEDHQNQPHRFPTPSVESADQASDSFYQWVTEYFPNTGFWANDDPGGYGLPLLLRYVFGLGPHYPERTGLPNIAVQPDPEGAKSLTIKYHQRRDKDVTVAVEASSDLMAWQPLGSDDVVEIVADGEMEYVTVQDPVSFDHGTNRFMRISLVAPSHPGQGATPSGVGVTRMSRLRAKVTWDLSGAETYAIQRQTAGDGWHEIGNLHSPPFVDEGNRTRGALYSYRVIAQTEGMDDSIPSISKETTVPKIRLTMIGDSNLQRGASESNQVVVKSYVGNGSRPAIDTDDIPDHPSLLSGRVMLLRPDVEAVNHGIDGTETGTGLGNTNRANVLHVVNGYTRFEGEMLAKGFPWTEDGVGRINAFAPLVDDFGYYSFGVNDIHKGVSPGQIRDNIAAAIDLWEVNGLSASNLMITTISPRPSGNNQSNVPSTNSLIRDLIAARGALLVDTSALVSNDDGLSWKGTKYHTDGIHFSDLTCDLIANEIVSNLPAEN